MDIATRSTITVIAATPFYELSGIVRVSPAQFGGNFVNSFCRSISVYFLIICTLI